MALCEQCGNFDDNEVENDDGIFHLGKRPKRRVGYQPDLYFYWHGDIEEDYDMGEYECLCEIASILTTLKARLNGKITNIHSSVPVYKLAHSLVAFLPLVTIIRV